MSEFDSLAKELQILTSEYRVDDYLEGVPYLQARELCNSYKEYQYCCEYIDAEGDKIGIDPLVISKLHSTYERLFFVYDVEEERLGSGSRRIFVMMRNAAPGAFNSLCFQSKGRTVFFPSHFMVAEGKIYRVMPPKGDWAVISNTVLCPIAIYYNLEKQTEVYTIAYRWHEQVHTFDCLPSDIHDLKYIKKLPDRGIAIVMEHAKYIREFIESIIYYNRNEAVAEIRTTDSLGWMNVNGSPDFVPFSRNLVYSGEHSTQNFINTFIEPAGTIGKWVETINQFRDENHIQARIVLAASFASVLVKPLGVLPFAVDVWGGGSGSGKSVSLMTATSVWAKPGLDDGYIKKCDSTMRSLESDAAVLNNLPLCIDETQTVADRRKFDSLIYNLCSGESHGALAPNKKKQEEKHWANSIILTGEQPIATDNSLAGATNRVVDIECPNVLFWEDTARFPAYCSELRENYGTAGRLFIDNLCVRNGIDKAKAIFEQYLNELQHSATGKQAASAAVILTADSLVAEWIFKDELKLSTTDILTFLKDDKAVDTNERAHTLILEWIATNSGKFEDGKNTQLGRYGVRNGRRTCEIVRKPLNEFLARNGFSDRSYLSWARNSGKIYFKENDPDRRNDIQERFNGERVRFVCIYIDDED